MAEIVEDGNGAKLAFSNLAKAAVKRASVASTEFSSKNGKLASVNSTSAPN
jgi:hypothetical protein